MATKASRKTRRTVVPARPSASTAATAADALKALTRMGSATTAELALRFFKTGTGQYGAGDRFLGISVPVLRDFVRDLKDAGFEVALPLLKSSWHEARAVALLLLIRQFQRSDEQTQERIYRLYLKSTRFINSWDLVDMSAEHIVGGWLEDKPALREIALTRLAASKSLWERRIAILATFHYIKKGDMGETLRIAKLLLKDEEDLIQKAVGWMLREVGKRISEHEAEAFLQRHYRDMPRTMLRYAIERFDEPRLKFQPNSPLF